MKLLLSIFSYLAFLGATAVFAAVEPQKKEEPKKEEPKKDDTIEKLLGKWEVIRADASPDSLGGIVTFEKDGKLSIVIKTGNGKDVKVEGNYKLEKDKLTTDIGNGSPDTDTIKKLTADDLELENADKKVTIMKKKK